MGAAAAQPPGGFHYGDIPLDPDVYDSLLREPADAALEALPAAYDARAEGLVTPAKDQGACGSCWAFASAGAFESHLLKAMDVGPEDFAEQQQVSCNTEMLGCDGGSADALRFWEAGRYGPIDEAGMPYTADDTTPCAYSCMEKDYRVAGFHTVPTSTLAFKESLYNYGPSYWRFDVYSDFGAYWSYGSPGQVYVNTTGWREGGHAVLLIGWDDAKGAFLCKNSWGAAAGPNGDGTFWIAYGGHMNDLGFGMANFEVTSGTGYEIELGFCSLDGQHYCEGIGLNLVGDQVSATGGSIGCVAGAVAGPITGGLWPFGTGISIVAAFTSGHDYAPALSAFEIVFSDYPLWRLIDNTGYVVSYGILCEPPTLEAVRNAPFTAAGGSRPTAVDE
jgi:hypothetical protein